MCTNLLKFMVACRLMYSGLLKTWLCTFRYLVKGTKRTASLSQTEWRLNTVALFAIVFKLIGIIKYIDRSCNKNDRQSYTVWLIVKTLRVHKSTLQLQFISYFARYINLTVLSILRQSLAGNSLHGYFSNRTTWIFLQSTFNSILCQCFQNLSQNTKMRKKI